MNVENKAPLVSVIMTTYNRAAMLPRAIESILNQTMSDLEFIVVDDGSTDDTMSVLAKYQRQDSRIVLLQQSNSGLSAARNLGIQRACGKYITLLDDDDYCRPDRVKVQTDFLEAHRELQACACLSESVDEKTGHPRQKFFDYLDIFRPHDKAEEVSPPAILLDTTTMITRAALMELKGYRAFFPCAEDYDLTLRFQERFKARLLKQCLYYHGIEAGYERMTKRDYCLVMNMHIIGHISAWYRRNKGVDPVEENKTSEEIIPMLCLMPPSSRKYLIPRVEEGIKNILPLPAQRTKKNLRTIKKTFAYVRPGLIWRRRHGAKVVLTIYYLIFRWQLSRILKRD